MKVSPKSRRRLRLAVAFCACAYPALLSAVWFGFYHYGEDWWVTATALYAPRLPLLAPAPVLCIALWVSGQARWAWTQVLAVLLAVFPLMGFVLPRPATAANGPKFRVLSYNVNSGSSGPPMVDAFAALSPDIALAQEAPWNGGMRFKAALHAHFPYVHNSTQFSIASRFPILSATEPPPVNFYGQDYPAGFMRYVIDTPLGQVAFFSVHPISPRGLLGIGQLRGVLSQLRSGKAFAGDPQMSVRFNASLREHQIAAAANAADREELPLVLAGDINLPGLSKVFRRHFSSYTDGFRAAGWGFGYSYTARHPFLRLDRILANQKLRFLSFEVGCPDLSDHRCVFADIQAP